MCAGHLALCCPTLNMVIQVKMGWSCCCRLHYEAGGRPNSYNNNCDSTQRLSGNSYGEIQQSSKLDDQLAGTKNQVPVSYICFILWCFSRQPFLRCRVLDSAHLLPCALMSLLALESWYSFALNLRLQLYASRSSSGQCAWYWVHIIKYL